jgi:AraC-like DNA-binding protein
MRRNHRRVEPGQTLRLGSELSVVLVDAGTCRGRDHTLLAPPRSALVLGAPIDVVVVPPSRAELICFDIERPAGLRPPHWLVLSPARLDADERLRAFRTLLCREQEADVAACLVEALVRAACRQHAGAKPAPLDRAVRRALELMHSALHRAVSVSELARAAGLSRAAFARRFCAAVGAPPERHLFELRMRRASELLADPDLGLAAVAAEVGYSSEFAFSRAFKRWSGMAPGRYRAGDNASTVCLAA